MEYKYLMMDDSEYSEYKDICSLDLHRTEMNKTLSLYSYPSALRERFDKILLGVYKGKNIRNIYQICQWINNSPTVWDDDTYALSTQNTGIYILPSLDSIETDLVNKDLY